MTTKSVTPTTIDEDVLLDVGGAATLLGYSHFWVIEHTTGGKQPQLPCIRIGRKIKYRRADLREFIEAHSKAA